MSVPISGIWAEDGGNIDGSEEDGRIGDVAKQKHKKQHITERAEKRGQVVKRVRGRYFSPGVESRADRNEVRRACDLGQLSEICAHFEAFRLDFG